MHAQPKLLSQIMIKNKTYNGTAHMSVIPISANDIDQNCKHLQIDTSIGTLIKKTA